MQHLADAVKRHPSFEAATPVFVSVYRRLQCYGGPEEGGWWYDRFILQGSVPFATREDAGKWLAAAEKEVELLNAREQPARTRAMASLPDVETCWSSEGWIPKDWNDGGDLWVTIEEKRGEFDTSTEPRPHYE